MKRLSLFFFNDTATTEIYTLSLHDALPICRRCEARGDGHVARHRDASPALQRSRAQGDELVHHRSEEHTSELQSLAYLVCRLLLEKKKKNTRTRKRLGNHCISTPGYSVALT